MVALTNNSTSGPGQLPSIAQVLYPYGVGIDTHSKFIQVCVLRQRTTAEGTAVDRLEREFPTTWHGLQEGRAWVLASLGDRATPDSLRYCIESTGTYHFPVLKCWQGIPCVINPHLTGPTRRKTDVLDARLLAHYSITGLWKPSFVPTDQAQVLRVLWAAHREHAQRATRCSNRLNNIVLRFGHTFGRRASMRSAEGEGLLSDLIEGRVPAVPDVAPDGLPRAVRPLICGLMADLQAAMNEDRIAVSTTLEFVRSRDWPTAKGFIPGTQLFNILTSVPGVGVNTALAWLAEVTDPRRFENAKQVAAFAGCDPSLKVSAGKVTSYTKRQGNLRLHHALLYAAKCLMTQANEPLGRWGRAIAGRHKKGGHRKGTAAVARRIACALWHVHRKAEMFSYEQYALACAIAVPDVPIASFLPPRACKILREHKLFRTRDLAAAYAAGTLAGIHGLGTRSIALIKDWITEHGTPVRPQQLSAPPFEGAQKKHGRAYALKPDLAYQTRGHIRKVTVTTHKPRNKPHTNAPPGPKKPTAASIKPDTPTTTADPPAPRTQEESSHGQGNPQDR